MDNQRKIVPVICLFAMVVAAGCASTSITSQEQFVTGQLPRPAHIWVYDFAATPADVPPDSVLANQPTLDAPSQTDDQVALGRELGAQIATKLVNLIRAMGMPAEHGETGATWQINDIVLRGYIISINQGSEAQRIGIGLGAGASDLKAAVEGFKVTAQGLRKLGGGSTDAGDSKTPGMVVGAAMLLASGNPAGLILTTGMKVYGEESGRSKVEGRADQTAKEIADVLKQRFKEQGWIN
jgi:hypothetical protein